MFEEESDADLASPLSLWKDITTTTVSTDVQPVKADTKTPPPAIAPALPEPAKPQAVSRKPGNRVARFQDRQGREDSV